MSKPLRPNITVHGLEWQYHCAFFNGPEPYVYPESMHYYQGTPSKEGEIYILAKEGLKSDDRLVVFK